MVFVPLKRSDSVAVIENDDGKRTTGLHLVIYQTLLSKKSNIVAIFCNFHVYVSA